MKFFFAKYRLCCFDPLYRDIIKGRTLSERLEYCQSLLFRIQSDLSRKQSSPVKKKLKLQYKATVQEIRSLQKLIKLNN